MKTATVLLSSLFLLASPPLAEPIPRGSVELSGAGAFQNYYGDQDVKALALSPSVHFYASPNFFLGPVAEFVRQWDDDSHVSRQILGGEAAFITRSGASHTHVYLGGGVGWARQAYSFEGFMGGEDVEGRENGHSLSAFLGFKFRLGGDFYLNIQPTLDWIRIEDNEVDIFSIKMGFSGILDP